MLPGSAHRVSEANSYFENELINKQTSQAELDLRSSSSDIDQQPFQRLTPNVQQHSAQPSQLISDADTSITPQVRCCPLNRGWYNTLLQ